MRNNYIIYFVTVSILFFWSGCATQQKTEIPVLKEKETAPEEVKRPSAATTTTTAYTIQKGDTLWRISKKYGVSVDSITAINQIENTRDLKIGQKIIIPSKNVSYNSYGGRTVSSRNSVSSKGFIWPVKGEIVSHYNQTKNGKKFMGISIQPQAGQKIVAAKKGTVEAISSLENNFHVVVIKHDWSVRTLYGGHYIPIVGEGNYIEQGQPIATFDSNTPDELSFKVYVKDKPVNPISYLP
ncbi:MAG: LysM peptidoglycan-binding domain-containing protein [Planctomycetes bacterium]|nr:LysM peptidoglycan-binding domain-containing protein [Planctomycetota bacterium]